MTKTLLEETRIIQKRLGSTPFPDDLQGIADDANVIIARQAFKIAQLKGDLTKAHAAALAAEAERDRQYDENVHRIAEQAKAEAEAAAAKMQKIASMLGCEVVEI